MKLIFDKESVHAYLTGEIDHHRAKGIREEIDLAIYENTPKELILDFEDVSFMDSSGIGLVLGRYKLMREVGGKVCIEKTPPHIAKVFKLSGLDKLPNINMNQAVK
jgi:stage II sporulation protein AA (anti-sigma F factor antagonist)